jgi:hypothetical protein
VWSEKYLLRSLEGEVSRFIVPRVVFFLFAFICYNPCFTNSVHHGIFTDVVQLSKFYRFNLSILIRLITFGLFLKHVENTAEEVCDAYGVYVILQNQRWGKSLKYCWSVV